MARTHCKIVILRRKRVTDLRTLHAKYHGPGPGHLAYYNVLRKPTPHGLGKGGTRTYRVHCKGGKGDPPDIGMSPCMRNCGSPQIPLWHRSVAGPCFLLLHTGPPVLSSNTTVAQVRDRSVALGAPHTTADELCKYHCGTGPWQVRGSCCYIENRQCAMQIPLRHRSVAGPWLLLLHMQDRQ